MTSTELVSMIVGIVGGLLGLISFFAAIIFYIQGNKLNRQSEKILSNIDSKVNLIQGDYGRFVDKSFDLAAGNIGYISDKLNEQMDILETSLKRSISESMENLNAGQTLTNLETNINRLIEETVHEVKKEATRIIEVSGSQVSEEGIEHYIMRSLRHGSVLAGSIKDYLRSHCLEITLEGLLPLLDNMRAKGLIEKDDGLNSRLRVDRNNGNSSIFWRLTRAGEDALANGIKTQ